MEPKLVLKMRFLAFSTAPILMVFLGVHVSFDAAHKYAICQFLFRWIYYCHTVVNPPERRLAKRTSVQRVGTQGSA